MICSPMARARKNFLLDDRVIGALDSAAKKAGCKSANAFVEQLLFNALKMSGTLGPDEQPLGEGRGGRRPGAGAKRSADDPADTENSLSTDSDGSTSGP